MKVDGARGDARGRGELSSDLLLQGVGKEFILSGRRVPVLADVDFYAEEGEFVSIIGPSGCGKSTFLNIVAGLEEPTRGTIYLYDSAGEDAPSRLGRLGYMQQKDLLFPWRTVLDNAILAMEVRGVRRSNARRRALELMERFGLKGFEHHYPHALSGGMRQRAAFLRTVLADREIILLDEPFGALDALTRAQMQEWLLDLWESFRKTIVLVTHDVEEAVFLSDRVYLFTARPAKVKMVISTNLPRPRHYDMVTQEDFVALKGQLLTALREEGQRAQGEEEAWPAS